MKMCTKCKEVLPLSDFRKQGSTKDGLKYYCKECDDKLAKSYYQRNKNKITDKVKEWQKNNPNKVKVTRNLTTVKINLARIKILKKIDFTTFFV